MKTIMSIARRCSRFFAVVLVSVGCAHQTAVASGDSTQDPDEARTSLSTWFKETGTVNSTFQGIWETGLERPDGLNPNARDLFRSLRNNTAAQSISAVGEVAAILDKANTLKKDGLIAVGRDYGIGKAAEIVGNVTRQATIAILAGGAAPSFLVLVAGCAAGYVAQVAVESALESFWAMLEKWLKEAFAVINIDRELDAILDAAKKDMELALHDRLRDLEAERARLRNAPALPNRVDSELRQAPNSTLGIALASGLQLVQHTLSEMPHSGAPASASAGNRQSYLYEVQYGGIMARQPPNGTGWEIAICSYEQACVLVDNGVRSVAAEMERYVGVLDAFPTNSPKALSLLRGAPNPRSISRSELRPVLRQKP